MLVENGMTLPFASPSGWSPERTSRPSMSRTTSWNVASPG